MKRALKNPKSLGFLIVFTACLWLLTETVGKYWGSYIAIVVALDCFGPSKDRP